jgi:hypothetical protein
MDTSEIGGFWKWFADHADDIAEAALATEREGVHTEALQALDEHIQRLGPFSWEVGPGKEEENALVISPSGDYEQLRATRAIVAEAPSIPGWQFYPAKPSKEWNYTFELHDAESSYEIDARQWRYILFAYPDGTYDIDVVAPNLENVPEDRRQEALEIAVQGAIGEELRIGFVGEIRHVASFSTGSAGIPLLSLEKQLPELIQKAARA